MGFYPVGGLAPTPEKKDKEMAYFYPYADPDLSLTDFRYIDWLVLGRGPETLKRGDREAMYVVMEDYAVHMKIDGKPFLIVVPKGMTTDMASVPKIFRNIVGRIGPHLEACIVHDWLYIAWQLQNRMPTRADHKFANRVLYAGAKAAGCNWVTRTALKIAMEAPMFSWSVFKGRDKNLFVSLEGIS